MNNRQYIVRSFTFILVVVLALAGCATPQATPCPTAETPSCPTAIAQTCPTSEPQSCPTTAAQAVPERSNFRVAIASMTNAIITFESGDKCSIQVVNAVFKGSGLKLEVVVDDNTYMDYIVWIYYVDPGKTLEDLKTLDTDPIVPAPFVHIMGAILTSPISRAYYASQPLTINADQGPIYFTCQVDGPVPRKTIDHLGPLEIK